MVKNINDVQNAGQEVAIINQNSYEAFTWTDTRLRQRMRNGREICWCVGIITFTVHHQKQVASAPRFKLSRLTRWEWHEWCPQPEWHLSQLLQPAVPSLHRDIRRTEAHPRKRRKDAAMRRRNGVLRLSSMSGSRNKNFQIKCLVIISRTWLRRELAYHRNAWQSKPIQRQITTTSAIGHQLLKRCQSIPIPVQSRGSRREGHRHHWLVKCFKTDWLSESVRAPKCGFQ